MRKPGMQCHRSVIWGAAALSVVSVDVYAAKMLEEVVVTAQRRSQSTQDIPVAITGMSSDQLEKYGFESANDVATQVPNMQVSGPYGDVQPIFAIRGVSMSDYSSNQASPIGVYVDEAYLAPVYSHGANFFDIERLEVLRGPQGTLYGKNTTGGAINIITRTPQIGDAFNGYFKFGSGSYGASVVEGGVENTLIEDKLAVRIAGSKKQDSGYTENALGGSDLSQTDFEGVRLAVNWDVTDSINAVFKYTNATNDALTTQVRNEPRQDIRGSGQEAGTNGFIDNTGYSRPARGLDFHEVESNKPGALVTYTDIVGLTLSYNAESYSIISVSSWYDAQYEQAANTDGSPTGLLEIDWASDTIGYSQDLRFVSEFTGMFNIIAGVYYGFEDLYMNNIYAIYETPPDPRVIYAEPDAAALAPYLVDFGAVDQRLATEKASTAVYTQMRFDFTEKFGMDVGLRWTKDDNRLTYLNISRVGYDGEPRGTYVPGNETGVDNAFIPLALNPSIEDVLANPNILVPQYTHGPYTLESAPQLKAVEREWTGKIGIDYRFNESLMAYASVSRGYRSGSFNGGVYYEVRPLETAYARPEFIDAYEIGAKADLMDGRLRMNAAVFLYDYTDQQFINVVGISNFLENAGSSQIAGMDGEIWFQATDRLILQFAFGVLDTEYKELSLADTTTLLDSEDEIDLAGNELISAPKLNYSISIDYDLLMTEFGYLTLNANANYQDDQWYSAYNEKARYDQIKQDDYWLANARLTWFSSDERWNAAVWVKNIEDVEYDVYAIQLQSGFGYDYFLPGAPRTWGAEVNVRF